MKSEVDNTVKAFAKFLNASWEVILPLLFNRHYTTNDGSIGDWLQSNWELLVERRLLNNEEYLEIYGNGADFYGSSSRITDNNVIPTHYLKLSINGDSIYDLLKKENVTSINDMSFEKFVGFSNGFYIDEPPFEYLLAHDRITGAESVFEVKSIYFNLEKF